MSDASQPSQDPLSGPARLRRLAIAEVLDSALQLYRANFRTFSSAVASVMVTMCLLRIMYGRYGLSGVDWEALSPLRSEALLGAIGRLRPPITSLALLSSFATTGVLYLITRVLLTGILVHTAAQRYLGPSGASLPERTRGLWREVALIPGVLLMLPLDLGSGLVARGMRGLVLFVAAALQGTTLPLTIVLDTVRLLGPSLLFIFLAVLVSAPFLLAPQAVMLERRSAFASLGRSWRLTGGRYWRVVLVGLVTSALVGLLIGSPVALARLVLAISHMPWGAEALLGGAVAAQVLEALALPFQVAVFTVLFYDIRIRKEGYDLEVLAQQATEADAEPLIQSAWQKLQHNDPRGALVDSQQALRLKPNNADLNRLCAFAYVVLSDHTSALASSERAVALEPHSPYTLNCRGYVKQAGGDMRGALADYRRVIAIQPDYPIGLEHFADLKLRAGNVAAALKDLEQLLEITPNNTRALYNAASLYARQGQLDKALQQLGRAIDLKPSWRESASSDPDFDVLRADSRFIALMTPPQ